MGPIDIGVALLLGAGGLAALGAVLALIRGLKPTSKPGVNAVLAALEPYAQRGIYAAEQLALQAFKDTKAKIAGIDKKAIADSVYDALPEFLMVGPIPVPISGVKYLVPRERWSQLVQDVFAAGDAFVTRNVDYLKKQVDAFVVAS